ncbi:MAG: methionyl-tRNA formyltransferase [Proteobacteria bacterium]|nr:methionyl-tRNA formyltransferase [Pseudomonadota bacterium]
MFRCCCPSGTTSLAIGLQFCDNQEPVHVVYLRVLILRIVFMGSPQEVVAPLQQLLTADGDFNVIAVVSQPARPVGRSGKLQDPPLAEFAKANGILTLQPESARDPEFLEQLSGLNVDVIVTAAYGQILSKKFLAIPKRATINIHPSLLPKYRGATPVPAALLQGERSTGVSVLFTVKALDAGAIICAEESAIAPGETSGTLTQRLFDFSGPILIQALEKLRDPDFVGQPQDDRAATYCGKIEKSDGAMDWSLPAGVNLNRYRALAARLFRPVRLCFRNLPRRSSYAAVMAFSP